jgi:hypothetical protein
VQFVRRGDSEHGWRCVFEIPQVGLFAGSPRRFGRLVDVAECAHHFGHHVAEFLADQLQRGRAALGFNGVVEQPGDGLVL